jgi:hypothetical protein
LRVRCIASGFWCTSSWIVNYTHDILDRFAENTSALQEWCSYWEITYLNHPYLNHLHQLTIRATWNCDHGLIGDFYASGCEKNWFDRSLG